MTDGREIYLFVFPTTEQSQYWFRQTVDKFAEDAVSKDYRSLRLTFEEADWYFRSEQTLNHFRIHESQRFGPEALYIILDDPERKRLPTYCEEVSKCVAKM